MHSFKDLVQILRKVPPMWFAIFGIILLAVIVYAFTSHKPTSSKQGFIQYTQPREKPLDDATMIRKAKSNHTTMMYTVKVGDTLASLAQKFSLSMQTIKWANNLRSDVTPGQVLIILPVNGVLHQVKAGETVTTLATLYHTDKQKIISYPFNTFKNTNTYELIPGEMLIIPDGSM